MMPVDMRRPEGIKRRKWRIKLIFLCITAGALWYLIERYDMFRMRGIETYPAGIISSAAVWEALPESAEHFWPSLLWNAAGFIRSIEGFYPVKISLSPSGWGRMHVDIEPLKVFALVSWNSRKWMLSEDGRMWLTSLANNTAVKGIEYPDEPILAWDETMPIPIDPERQGADIYVSSLNIEKIKKWYDTIDQTSWKGKIYCLLAKKIEGRPAVQILFGTEGAITTEIILRDDAQNWIELASAMKEIFPKDEYLAPPGKMINATFSDMKFTVTDKGRSTVYR